MITHDPVPVHDIGIGSIQIQKKLSERKDEIGAISRAVDILPEQLVGVIGRIEEHSATVMETSHRLNSDTDMIFNTVQQVDQAVQDMADGAMSQADETQKATENIVFCLTSPMVLTAFSESAISSAMICPICFADSLDSSASF